jgi:hypothetical protein
MVRLRAAVYAQTRLRTQTPNEGVYGRKHPRKFLNNQRKLKNDPPCAEFCAGKAISDFWAGRIHRP